MSDDIEVYTVGHSTLSYEDFVNNLLYVGVTVVADVRSAPFSRRFPHFNREILKNELRADSIEYVFLGEELGGRPTDSQFFCEGVADYERMAEAPAYKRGIDWILTEKNTYRIALMCSEHSPLDCHRCLLVGRTLKSERVKVGHILSDRRVLSHSEIEDKLLKMADLGESDMFKSTEELLEKAYRYRSQRVAYSDSASIAHNSVEKNRYAAQRSNDRIHQNYGGKVFRSALKGGG